MTDLAIEYVSYQAESSTTSFCSSSRHMSIKFALSVSSVNACWGRLGARGTLAEELISTIVGTASNCKRPFLRTNT